MAAYIYYPKDWILGTDHDDYLYGTDSKDTMLGFAGNDHLRGNGGDDNLSGQEGDDTLDGGAGSDRLDGGTGIDTATFFGLGHAVIVNLEFGTARTLGPGPAANDTLISIENVIGTTYDDHIQGNETANRLVGMGGNDVLMGWGGDDTLDGHFGNDYLVGGAGNDVATGGFGSDTMIGNEGFDVLDFSYSYQGMIVSLATGTSRTYDQGYYVDTDSFWGFEGVVGTHFNDTLEGDGLVNRLVGGLGDDRLVGNDGNDTLDGGVGADTLDGGAGADAFIGGTGFDWIDYRTSSNVVAVNLTTGTGHLGDALWDTYSGMEGIFGSQHAAGDILTGSGAANWIEGLGGNDVIRGLGGGDTLNGGSGIDSINGGGGRDHINGGDGADTLDGGAGFDTINLNPSFGGIGPEGPGVVVDLAAGTVSGLGNDGERIFNFEAVIGTSFDDVIIGNDARNVLRGGVNQDTIRGGGGNDLILGEDGNDMLFGDAGPDALIGGLGRDIMTGGDGRDRFIFNDIVETGETAATRDIVRDFVKGEDLIVLTGVDADTTAAGNQGFLFIDDDAFTGAAGQLRSFLQGANTVIEGDVDGDSVADFQVLLNGNINLSALDFAL